MHRANYTISEQVFGKQTFAYRVCMYVRMYTFLHTCCMSMVFWFSWEYYYYQRLLTELIWRARRELPIYDDCGCCICFNCCCFGFANDRICLSVQFSIYIYRYRNIYTRFFFLCCWSKFWTLAKLLKINMLLWCARYFLALFRRLFFARKQK